MNVNYKRDLNHNYMMIAYENPETTGYEVKMLMENQLPGFLPFSVRHMDSECFIYYEISSKQPMERIFQHMEIGYEDLNAFLFHFHQILRKAEEYLIDPDHIVIDPAYIYMNVETQDLSVCFYPDHQGSAKEAFRQLVEYILNRVNHDDEKAVMLAYKIYKNTRNTNFILEEILNLSSMMVNEKETSVLSEESAAPRSKDPWEELQPKSVEDYHEDGLAPEDFKGESHYNENVDEISENKHKKDSGTRTTLRVGFLSFLGMVVVIYAKAAGLLPESITYQQFLLLIGLGGMVMMGSIIKLIIDQAKKKVDQEETDNRDEADLWEGTQENTFMRDNHTNMERHTGTERHIDVERYTGEERHTSTDSHIGAERHTDTERHISTDRYIGAKTHRDTERHTSTESHIDMEKYAYTKKEKPMVEEGYAEEDNQPQSESIKIYDFLTSREGSCGMVAEEGIYQTGIPATGQSYLGNTMLIGDFQEEELRELTGKIKGKQHVYSLKELPVTIGKKEDCVDIAIRDPSVSRMHARFFNREGKVYVEDLNSTNGTFKNSVRLEANETVEVEIHDEIAFGKIVFTYH
ncbi:MAG: DUF6382 domain-containing protein [Lachnospiraceae bacterium]|nr:DUF6382 domain-containing protein [Lachnospiraceae bacterium]